MASDSKGGRLPFEPRQNKKKSPQTQASGDRNTARSAKAPNRKKTSKASATAKDAASLSAIPKAVSNRMARRMVFFCGIPSALGMSSLVIFYWLFERGIIDFPPYVALFVSVGFLALGVGGLSFGIFSASWDENRVGSLLGIEELKINLPRTLAAWRNGSKQGN
jgi:hypothetical protein